MANYVYFSKFNLAFFDRDTAYPHESRPLSRGARVLKITCLQRFTALES